MLNKDEKARVLLSICDVKVENVVLHVDETITDNQQCKARFSMGSTRLAVTSIGRFTTVPCTS